MTDDQSNLQPLYRRQTVVTSKQNAAPFTTLNESAEQRALYKATVPTGDYVTSKSSDLTSKMTSGVNADFSSIQSDLDSIANQILTNEKQAEMQLKAQQTKDLTKWRKEQAQKFYDEITLQLESQGVTKEVLAKNPTLRTQINKWKREQFDNFVNSFLPETERAIIEENKTGFQENLREYEASTTLTVNKELQAQVSAQTVSEQNQIMKEAGFTGSWTAFQFENQKKQNIQQSLLDKGVITSDGSTYKLSKNIQDLTNTEIENLKTIGMDTTNFANLRTMINNGLISIDSNGNATIQKPITAITNSEITQLKNVGFDTSEIEKIPESPLMGAFNWSQTTYKDNPQVQAGFQFTEALFGQLLTDVTSIPGFVTKTIDVLNIIPDVDIQFRGPTLDTMQYMVNTTPVQRGALTATSIALSVGEGIIVGEGIGSAFKLTASGVGKLSVYLSKSEKLTSIIAKLPSFSYKSATAANIGKWLRANPKITNTLLFSTLVAGQETVSVLSQMQAGVPTETIVKNVGRDIGFSVGMLSGMNLLKPADKAVLQRATKIQGVQTSDGLKLILRVEEKQLSRLSKEGANLIQTVKDPVSGKTIIVGIGEREGAFPFKLTMDSAIYEDLWKAGSKGVNASKAQIELLKWVKTSDYYSLLENYPEILTGKLTAKQVSEIIANYAGKEFAGVSTEELSTLVGKVSKMSTMSEKEVTQFILKYPELAKVMQNKIDVLAAGYKSELTEKQLLDALYKELNEGGGVQSPLRRSVNEKGLMINPKTSFSIDLKAVYQVDGRDFIKELTDKLIQAGLKEDQAILVSTKILSNDVGTVVQVLKELKLNVTQEADILALRVEAGGPSWNPKSGIYRALKKGGLTDAQVQQVIHNVAASQEGVSKVLSSGIPKMNGKQLEALVDMVPQETLMNLKLAPEQLSRIINVMTPDATAQFFKLLTSTAIVGLDEKTLSKSFGVMTDEQVTQIVNRLSTSEYVQFASKLDVNALAKVLPNLSVNQLNDFMTVIDSNQWEEIVSKLDTKQANMLATKLGVPPKTLQQYPNVGLPNLISKIGVLPKKSSSVPSNDKNSMLERITMFDVHLQYPASSEQFKIKSQSFQGAASEAIFRKKTKDQSPRGIVVKLTSDTVKLVG